MMCCRVHWLVFTAAPWWGQLTQAGMIDVLRRGKDTQSSARKLRAKTSTLEHDAGYAGLADHEGRWHDPEYFGSFSQGESTYDEDADFGRAHHSASAEANYVDGWEPNIVADESPAVVGAHWFHESPSGGPAEAWQTHYPAMQDALAGRDAHLGEWYRTEGGSWHQEYKGDFTNDLPSKVGSVFDVERGTQSVPAGWFDSSVEQYDGFGRRKEPYPGSGRRFVDWQERAVNTTISCGPPGCMANATLVAFDGATERASHCRLSIGVKPTDFDDEPGGERVEFISVNDVNVAVGCAPRASGCNASAQRSEYPCVQDLNVDRIISTSGALRIAAKIPLEVDDCSYKGSLLYGVARVTCMVSEQVPEPRRLPQPGTELTANADGSHQLKVSAPLQCRERGCLASTTFALNQTAMTFKGCKLTVKVNVTDFDNTEWGKTPQELVEFVKVNGVRVARDVNPGKNPCQAAMQGKPLPNDQLTYTLVDKRDVTDAAVAGNLLIESKITQYVDQCPSNGNLLDGVAEVACDSVKEI